MSDSFEAAVATADPDAPSADAIAVDVRPSPSPASKPLRQPLDHDRVLLSPLSRALDLSTVVTPFIAMGVFIYLFWGHGVNWLAIGLIVGMYFFTGFGITIGYHRLFTHRAFETSRVGRIIFAIVGSLCVQGPLLWWVAVHRKHHHHSDQAGDPHSPHTHGHGFGGMLRGAWHSHMGWLFEADSPRLAAYVPDLMKDWALVLISDVYPLWVVLSMAIPAVLGACITRSWTGAVIGLIWGGVLRVFMVHHITWSVNSICHMWGAQPFDSHDQSRNNWFVGLFALGEGWHNNHHAFPNSARHGMNRWQPDTSYMLIWVLEKLGWVWRVKIPSQSAIAAKLELAKSSLVKTQASV